jgi:hypothetical protein
VPTAAPSNNSRPALLHQQLQRSSNSNCQLPPTLATPTSRSLLSLSRSAFLPIKQKQQQRKSLPLERKIVRQPLIPEALFRNRARRGSVTLISSSSSSSTELAVPALPVNRTIPRESNHFQLLQACSTTNTSVNRHAPLSRPRGVSSKPSYPAVTVSVSVPLPELQRHSGRC